MSYLSLALLLSILYVIAFDVLFAKPMLHRFAAEEIEEALLDIDREGYEPCFGLYVRLELEFGDVYQGFVEYVHAQADALSIGFLNGDELYAHENIIVDLSVFA